MYNPVWEKQESIEWFKEDQALSPSYDWAPSPLLSSRQVFLSQSSCVSPVEPSDGRGGGGDVGGAKSYDGEKAWSSINHSVLSVKNPSGSSDCEQGYTLHSEGFQTDEQSPSFLMCDQTNILSVIRALGITSSPPSHRPKLTVSVIFHKDDASPVDLCLYVSCLSILSTVPL